MTIILKAEGELQDNKLWEYVSKLVARIENINKRTKTIYVYLRDFEKRIKKLESR